MIILSKERVASSTDMGAPANARTEPGRGARWSGVGDLEAFAGIQARLRNQLRTNATWSLLITLSQASDPRNS